MNIDQLNLRAYRQQKHICHYTDHTLQPAEARIVVARTRGAGTGS